MSAPQFTFNFYKFTGTNGDRHTELVRDHSQADGMRGLVERNQKHIELATERAVQWGETKGLTLNPQEPYPSEKYPGKVWLEFRFGGLTL